MGSNIIRKDIAWLTEKVPDFMDFYKNQSYYFANNGYLAGGFLRKIIKNGSVEKTLNSTLENGDIDFFFYNEDAAEKCFEWFAKLKGSHTPRVSASNKNNVVKFTPNSVTGFAFEGSGIIMNRSMKFQFIAKSTGTPEQVLNRFDISNCKIATDVKSIWMVEDWEEIEQQKVIRVDNLAGKYLPWRLKKYIGKDYSLYQSNYKEVLVKLIEILNSDSTNIANIRSLARNKKVITSDSDVLLFHQLLGQTWENTSEEDYEKGTLGQKEDFAIHIYKDRIKETNDRA